MTKPLSDTSGLPSASRDLSGDVYHTSLDHILDELARIDLIIRNRRGQVRVKPGYDGVYGEPTLDVSPQKKLGDF